MFPSNLRKSLKRFDNYDTYETLEDIPQHVLHEDKFFFIKSLGSYYRYDPETSEFKLSLDMNIVETKLAQVESTTNNNITEINNTNILITQTTTDFDHKVNNEVETLNAKIDNLKSDVENDLISLSSLKVDKSVFDTRSLNIDSQIANIKLEYATKDYLESQFLADNLLDKAYVDEKIEDNKVSVSNGTNINVGHNNNIYTVSLKDTINVTGTVIANHLSTGSATINGVANIQNVNVFSYSNSDILDITNNQLRITATNGDTTIIMNNATEIIGGVKITDNTFTDPQSLVTKNYVDASMLSNQETINTQLATKADTISVDTQLNTKANISYVDDKVNDSINPQIFYRVDAPVIQPTDHVPFGIYNDAVIVPDGNYIIETHVESLPQIPGSRCWQASELTNSQHMNPTIDATIPAITANLTNHVLILSRVQDTPYFFIDSFINGTLHRFFTQNISHETNGNMRAQFYSIYVNNTSLGGQWVFRKNPDDNNNIFLESVLSKRRLFSVSTTGANVVNQVTRIYPDTADYKQLYFYNFHRCNNIQHKILNVGHLNYTLGYNGTIAVSNTITGITQILSMTNNGMTSRVRNTNNFNVINNKNSFTTAYYNYTTNSWVNIGSANRFYLNGDVIHYEVFLNAYIPLNISGSNDSRIFRLRLPVHGDVSIQNLISCIGYVGITKIEYVNVGNLTDTFTDSFYLMKVPVSAENMYVYYTYGDVMNTTLRLRCTLTYRINNLNPVLT